MERLIDGRSSRIICKRPSRQCGQGGEKSRNRLRASMPAAMDEVSLLIAVRTETFKSLSAEFAFAGARVVGQEAVMPDLHEPARQDVQQKAADEFHGGKRHRALLAATSIILPAERYLAIDAARSKRRLEMATRCVYRARYLSTCRARRTAAWRRRPSRAARLDPGAARNGRLRPARPARRERPVAPGVGSLQAVR